MPLPVVAMAASPSPRRCAGKYQIVQDLKTRLGAKTMAIDARTHTVFLPTAEYGKEADARSRPIAKPQTFMVLVARPSIR